MTRPLSIVSGIAFGVTLAAPALGLAAPVDPPLTREAAARASDPTPAPVALPAAARHKDDEALEEADDGADAAPRAAGSRTADARSTDGDDSDDTEAADENEDADTNEDADADDSAAPHRQALADEDGATIPADDRAKPLVPGLPAPGDEADGAATPAGAAAGATPSAHAASNPTVAAAPAGAPLPPLTGAPAAATAPRPATADPDADAGTDTTYASPLAQELVSGLYTRINLLGYGILQGPVNSNLNPNNALAVPRYQTQFDVRPDFDLNFRQLELGIKPRFEAAWSRVQSGVQGGTDLTTATAYINEWIARYRVTDQLLVSYGRENLQWGPSQLLSPSNPFNQNNGKNNPAIEQPGQDYARIVVIPNSSLTTSLIANTAAGRLDDSGEASGPFHRAYAAKLDYTGERTYFSMLVSKRETTPWRIGYFGGWNVSDALLAYSEGSAALSHDPALPHPDYSVLVGATYTLVSGATITGEYFHHNAGCTDDDIARCVSPLALDPTNPYPRRDYLLLQYVDTKLARNVSLTVRVIQDLNDHSTEFVSDLEYEVGQNWLLYFVPSVTVGSRSTEFGSLVRYSIFAGVSFTF